MKSCPLYGVHTYRIQSNEMHAQGQTTVRVPYCAHRNSPMPRHLVMKVLGAANILTCGGDLDKCQVPLEQR